jgi:hypothetical protein
MAIAPHVSPSAPLASPGPSSITGRALRLTLGMLVLTMLASPAARGQDPALRSFDRELLLETTSETSASVSLGDVHGDGHLDIVLAKGRHWPLDNLILRNDGKGRFTTAVLGEAPDRTYSAALADLDGDGHLDIVVSNDRPDRKLIYLNDGRGHFRVAGTFGRSEWSTRYVTVADLNGDMRPDLVVANRSSNPATPSPSFVCLNDGKGGFPSCSPLATESATIIVAADLDGDGRVDLFVPHRDGGQNLIFWNDGTGRFAAVPSRVGSEHSWIRAAAAADINGDGIRDLVVGDERAGTFLYLGVGHRSFDAPAALGSGPGAPYAIAVADLNRDGRPDIVVGRQEARGTVFFNLGRRVPRFSETPWNDGKGSVYGVAIGDLDGDGWPDIVAARSDAPNAVWFNGVASENPIRFADDSQYDNVDRHAKLWSGDATFLAAVQTADVRDGNDPAIARRLHCARLFLSLLKTRSGLDSCRWSAAATPGRWASASSSRRADIRSEP